MDNYQNKTVGEIDIIKKRLCAQGWNELCIPYGCDAENAAKYIVESKIQGYYALRGMKWFADFNGIIFYSTENLTERDILIAVYGCSPEERERKEKEEYNKYMKEKQEFEQKIPQIISEYCEKGHKILSGKYHAKWDEIVPIRVNDLYHGKELQAALDIIELLNNDDIDGAKKKFDEQNHSGMSASITLAIVKAFSDNGKNFVEKMNGKGI